MTIKAVHTLYRMFDADEQLLYIGITMDVTTRFRDHQREKPWWANVTMIRLQQFATREELEEAERAASAAENPVYNVRRYLRSPRQRSEWLDVKERLTARQSRFLMRVRIDAHRGPRDEQLRWWIDHVRRLGIGDGDIEWALRHPRHPNLMVQTGDSLVTEWRALQAIETEEEA